MTALTHRDKGAIVDVLAWLEGPLTALRPTMGHPMRVEDYLKDGEYILRAELPGVDPEKDVEVTVSEGILTIKADRHETTEGRHHSEFRYGTSVRSIILPPGADEERVRAIYGNGVLEVVVEMQDQQSQKTHRRIPVMINQHIKPT